MTNDWQSRLAALRDSMGDSAPDDTPSPEETAPQAPRQQRRLDIILERKGRAGKTATIIAGFDLPDDAVADIASRLKRALGTGGSSRGGEILIQGDRRADVLRWLNENGFKALVI